MTHRRSDDSCVGCYLIRPTLWWSLWWILSDLFDVAMTVMMDAIWFVRRCNDHRDWCYSIRPTLRWSLWWVLSDSSDIAVNVVIVWPSWLDAPENLPKGCNLLVCFLRQYDVPMGQSLYSGFCWDVILTYFWYWASNSYLGPSLWWWVILNPVE